MESKTYKLETLTLVYLSHSSSRLDAILWLGGSL